MMLCAKELIGREIHALDGPLGSLSDIYFDDASWNVRYFVVDIGTLFHRRKVLLTPEAVSDANLEERSILLKHTVDEIKRSPGAETDEPVFRQLEEQSLNYYGWVAHWNPMGGMHEPQPQPRPFGDTNLRSMKNVFKYMVMAFDGRVGVIEDFVIDRDSWHIPMALLDTVHFLPETHLSIPTKRLKAIRCADEEISIDMYRHELTKERILDLASV